ncbi:MAG: hypothetical protein GC185_12870 [Alphaproteobacteria bacterium]|nr:hypothetical protein [Alphaproteobacteria bacterium]
MKRDLETLRDVLWEQFEKAVERQPKYEDSSSSGEYTPSNFAVAGRQAIGQLGKAIVDVEREIRERDEQANGMKLPGKP